MIRCACLAVARLVLGIVVVMVLAFGFGVRVVETPSVPEGLWWIHDASHAPGALQRGMFVAFCLPARIAQSGLAYGYLAPGTCPGGGQSVIKRLVAIQGDGVCVHSDHVSVIVRGAGVHDVPLSARRVRDERGRIVPGQVISIGCRTLASNQVWLAGDGDPLSWDSRYWGPLDARLIFGVGQPLWITRAISPVTLDGVEM